MYGGLVGSASGAGEGMLCVASVWLVVYVVIRFLCYVTRCRVGG